MSWSYIFQWWHISLITKCSIYSSRWYFVSWCYSLSSTSRQSHLSYPDLISPMLFIWLLSSWRSRVPCIIFLSFTLFIILKVLYFMLFITHLHPLWLFKLTLMLVGLVILVDHRSTIIFLFFPRDSLISWRGKKTNSDSSFKHWSWISYTCWYHGFVGFLLI